MKPLYLQYAKLEEDYGLAKRAMRVYDQATKAVPPNEKLGMYEIYIARAADIFGVPKTREIYEQAIESRLPDKDVKVMCLRYAELEKNLGEIDRSRALYKHASQFADPRSDPDFWTKWHDFEVQHGNEDTFREMLRIKRSVSASYSQVKTQHLQFASCPVFCFLFKKRPLTFYLFADTLYSTRVLDAKGPDADTRRSQGRSQESWSSRG